MGWLLWLYNISLEFYIIMWYFIYRFFKVILKYILPKRGLSKIIESYNYHKRRKKRKIKYVRLFIFLIILVAVIWRIGLAFFDKSDKSSNNDANVGDGSTSETSAFEDTTIHLTAIGDIMCHGPNYKAAYIPSSDSYDFSPFFKNISEYTSKADLTIGNLETTFAGKDRGYSGYPTFNSPAELGQAIKDIGVDVLGTANNHCMDKGYSGLSSTLDVLDELEFSHMGTSRSVEEQSSILVRNVNGINIAFLAFTYGTNGISIPKDKSFSVNLIDRDLIVKQIESAKRLNVDMICVNMHWGVEYQTSPNSEQKELADFLFKNGVDIIFGSHPHVLQPMEKRTVSLDDGSTKDGFVIYSLGNFISNQSDVNTQDTIILNLHVTKSGKDGNISIDSFDYIPVYCYNKGNNAKNRYELIDLKKSISDYENGTSSISPSLYNTFKSELQRIEKIMNSNLN